MKKDLWSYSSKTGQGDYLFLDLKNDGTMKITLSQPDGNGGYNRSNVIIPKDQIEALGKAMMQTTPVKSFFIEDARKQDGVNAYTPWTKEDEQELLEMNRRGESIESIAKQLHRGTGAIESRLKKLQG